MCGICGVVGLDALPARRAVTAMMERMVHRGPDDEGIESFAPQADNPAAPTVVLGFRRLAILDLTPAGHQPMLHPQTGDCLAFNGEIYNFRELRRDLAAEGEVFRTTGDTEVLLHALTRWGTAALGRLQGMYAFAFREAATGRVLLARDPLGIKPLYLARLDSGFAFASEVNALLRSGLVSSEIDPAGVAGILAYGSAQGQRTLFRSISAFPAGCFQWVECRTPGQSAPPFSPEPFWTIPDTRAESDGDTAAATVRQLLSDAVGRHLVADVPVGVFLSAGIDSTIIASLAREHSRQVRSFTVGFDATHGEDEVAIAAATAKSLGIAHMSLKLDAGSIPERWSNWLSTMDSPSVDGFNTFLVSGCLRAEGVVVGLSGLGADELFGGYASFRLAKRLAGLQAALGLAPRGSRLAAARFLERLAKASGPRRLAALLEESANAVGVARSRRRVWSNLDLARAGLRPETLGLEPNYLDPEPSLPRAAGRPLDVFNAVSRFELSRYMRDTLLRDTDATSMRHSLEVRVPFLDQPLVDYALALPGDVKGPPGAPPKALLRQACKDRIPAAVLDRRKTGFTLPIGDWMRGPMREMCDAAISQVRSVGVLREAFIDEVWEGFCTGHLTRHWSSALVLVALGTCLHRQQGSGHP